MTVQTKYYNIVNKLGHCKCKISFRLLVTIIIFLTLSITMLLTAFAWLNLEIESTKKNSVDNATAVVNMLSQDIASIILMNDTNAAINMSAKLEAFSHIRYLELFDNKNKYLFSFQHSKEHTKFSELLSSNSQQSLVTVKTKYHQLNIPVNYQNENYGSVHILYSNENTQARINSFKSNLYWSIPSILAISLLLAIFLQLAISQPLKKMANFVKRISLTTRTSSRLCIEDTGELGTLANGFNKLINTVEQNQFELHTDKEKLHIILKSIAEGVIATNSKAIIEYLNPCAENIIGKNCKNLIGLPLYNIFKLQKNSTLIDVHAYFKKSLLKTVTLDQSSTNLLISSKQIPIQCTMSPIRNLNDNVEGVVIVFRNISTERKMAEKLIYQASHDELTGLYNRRAFDKELQNNLDTLIPNKQHALIYIDLDQFKIVNDTSGHAAGDALLKSIASILSNNTQTSDIIARLGGDEFAILLRNTPLQQAKTTAKNLLHAISHLRFSWGSHVFRTSASIGLVEIPDKLNTYVELLKQADIACYAAKSLGRNRLYTYRRDDRELSKIQGEIHWVSKIETALELNQFQLYIQKIVPINKQPPLHCFEILLRIHETNGTTRSPEQFLGAAERYNLITRLDQWVFRNVLQSKAALKISKTYSDVQFNINISYTTLHDPTTQQYLLQLINNCPIPPSSICFEFTETAASVNVPATLSFIKTMKQYGCKFALDDFGSGISSFGYLKSLPVDFIKIDGALVQDISNDKSCYAMVESINHIGKVMGLRTIAEYVHSAKTQKLLAKIEVDYMQGFYIHKPTALEQYNHKKANINKQLSATP